jgi:hypothetical protein
MQAKPTTLLVLLLSSLCAFAQPVIYVNTGSRATWGHNQELTIQADGSASYARKQVNGQVEDQKAFLFGRASLDSLFQKADETGFFNLSREIRGEAQDGSGVYITIRSGDRTHTVHAVNSVVPGVEDWMNHLNRLLSVHGIRMYYGQDQPRR